MADDTILLGSEKSPREYHYDMVQIMGSPEQDWSLVFAPQTIEAFLRSHLNDVVLSDPETSFGETKIDLTYAFPAGWELGESYGSLRLAPQGGLWFDRLSYGMTYDLLELILQAHPENKDIVVIFSEMRPLFHRAGMPRNEGIFRLQKAAHCELSKVLHPHDWEDS